jgi:hypothetical protein
VKHALEDLEAVGMLASRLAKGKRGTVIYYYCGADDDIPEDYTLNRF